MNTTPIKLVVVGCGAWGPNHIRNFSSIKGCEVVGIADVDRNRLERVAAAFPHIRCDTDYRGFLEDSAVQAVVVATPTCTHHSVVGAALAAGKHVLCEKPLCIRAQDAGELVKLARKNERILMVGHVFLFNPGIIRLKEILDTGDLGDVQYMSATRTNLGPIRRDVNASFDLASHDISIFNWLMGREPLMVSACGASFLQTGIEDVVNISLRYEPNVLATILVSWLSPKKVRQVTVVGNRKMVTWDDLDLTVPVAIYDKGAASVPEYSGYGEFLRVKTWDGDVRLPKVAQEEPLKAQAHYFADCICTGKVCRSDGDFSLGVVRVLEAINRSLANKGAPFDL